MKIILIALLILISTSIAYAELFKWKDAEGNLIYSDQPPPGSAKQDSQVDKESLPDIISVPAVDSSAITTADQPAKQSKLNDHYTSFTITQPIHDTAVRENSGKVTINVRVEPMIFVERGHNLVIYMDGDVVYTGQQTSVTLDNIDRGTHTLKATIVNSRGQSIKETSVTSFTLQRYHI